MQQRGTRTRRWSSALVGASLAAGVLSAQPPGSPVPSPSPTPAIPRVTFASEVAYVEIDAIVTDANGQPVRDLRREDFVVLEDGKPQAIDLFTQVDIPYERPEPAAPPTVQPDVQTNEHPFEGRLYVVVLDGLHTTTLRTPLVRAAARRFIERHFSEGDLAAVVQTAGGPSAGQELTGNRQMLLEAVDRFMGRKLPSVTLSRLEEYRRTQGMRQRGEAVADPDEMERAHNARNTLGTLKSVAEWLAAVRGRRKAVLFISEGIDINLYDSINNREASSVLDSVRQATAVATRSNVSFYTIDPRGLGGLSTEMMEIQPAFDEPGLGLDPQGLNSDLRLAQDSLRMLADETSGLATVNSNDFPAAFARLVKDNSAYYLLGYYPPSQKRDGRFHKLEVRVARPGLRVRARSGYSAPRGKPPARPPLEAGRETPKALAELLNSPLPRAGLSMSVQAAAFRGPADRASVMVAIQLPGSSFRFEEKDGIAHDTLELSVVAVDSAGKTTGGHHKVQLDLKPATRQVVNAGGFRVLSWLELKPGRHQIRVAGRAVNSEATGSVYYDLQIPDFAKGPLELSGVVLTSAVASRVPTAGPLQQLKEVLPGPPTTWRTFHPLDTIVLMTEIYDSEKTPHTLDIVTTLTAADGAVAHRSVDERRTEALGAASQGAVIVHTAQVPLKTIAPGLYTLRVEARSRMGKNPPMANRALLVNVVALTDPVPPAAR